MELKQENIKTFRNPRTGKRIRRVTSPNGMIVTWQREEKRFFESNEIDGSLDSVLDNVIAIFNKASRNMTDAIFDTSYDDDCYLSVTVTGWIFITIDEAEEFISDYDHNEVADREAARQQIERLRAQHPGL